jgi:hypothetical protein
MTEIIFLFTGSAIGASLSQFLILFFKRREEKKSKPTYEWLLEIKREENKKLSNMFITLREIERLEESNERFKKWINEIETESEEPEIFENVDESEHIREVINNSGRIERKFKNGFGEYVHAYDRNGKLVNVWLNSRNGDRA